MSSSLQVFVHDEQDDLPLDTSNVTLIIHSILEEEGEDVDEVSVRFVQEQTIADLHEEHFDDPTPTDCITFPIDEEEGEYRLLGEVVICPRVAIEYATAHKIDPYEETTRYLVHGLLHLLGYRDISEPEAHRMKTQEDGILVSLLSKDCILHEP